MNRKKNKRFDSIIQITSQQHKNTNNRNKNMSAKKINLILENEKETKNCCVLLKRLHKNELFKRIELKSKKGVLIISNYERRQLLKIKERVENKRLGSTLINKQSVKKLRSSESVRSTRKSSEHSTKENTPTNIRGTLRLPKKEQNRKNNSPGPQSPTLQVNKNKLNKSNIKNPSNSASPTLQDLKDEIIQTDRKQKFGKKYFRCHVKIQRLESSKNFVKNFTYKNNRKSVSFVETVEVFGESDDCESEKDDISKNENCRLALSHKSVPNIDNNGETTPEFSERNGDKSGNKISHLGDTEEIIEENDKNDVSTDYVIMEMGSESTSPIKSSSPLVNVTNVKESPKQDKIAENSTIDSDISPPPINADVNVDNSIEKVDEVNAVKDSVSSVRFNTQLKRRQSTLMDRISDHLADLSDIDSPESNASTPSVEANNQVQTNPNDLFDQLRNEKPVQVENIKKNSISNKIIDPSNAEVDDIIDEEEEEKLLRAVSEHEISSDLSDSKADEAEASNSFSLNTFFKSLKNKIIRDGSKNLSQDALVDNEILEINQSDSELTDSEKDQGKILNEKSKFDHSNINSSRSDKKL